MSICKEQLKALLKETPEAFYWLGFLFADGHFSKGRLSIRLARKDGQHIKKLAKFLGLTGVVKQGQDRLGNQYTSLSVMDTKTIEVLKNIYGIESNKTEYPPRCSFEKATQFLSFLIGFIDGDGCIAYQTGCRKDVNITIKCHSSWEVLFEEWHSKLQGLLNLDLAKPHLNPKGYAVWNIGNSIAVRFLTETQQELSLPVLKRKWSRVDVAYMSREEKGRTHKRQVLEAHAQGKTINEIMQLCPLSYSGIYAILSRAKLKTKSNRRLPQ